MKITQIKITDFHQFKDLTIDLTYPKGHAKEGQPLDKVCFIGQSGTGKTSLLELIPKILYNYNTPIVSKSGIKSILNRVTISVVFGLQNEYECSIKFTDATDEKYNSTWKWTDYLYNKGKIEFNEFININEAWSKKTATKSIYFPANLNYDIEINNENTLNGKDIIDFSKEKVAAVWNLILEEIQKYQEKEIQIRLKTSEIVVESSNNLETIKKAVEQLEEWLQKEYNPIKEIASNCLDRLLSHYKLRVKTKLAFNNKEDIGFIKVEDFSGNEIPHGLWSTGTKQVILSALPLYLLKPTHTVILFDEPERSLYPDMQRFIIDYYSSLTDNCQCFYSTHSPIVASSFEPWEIVELKFNAEGKVYRELYFEGENHVENYKWNPKYMRWDDILQRVFDMENDGSDERKELLKELATNNVKYKKLVKQRKTESAEAKDILNNIASLSKKLSTWEILSHAEDK